MVIILTVMTVLASFTTTIYMCIAVHYSRQTQRWTAEIEAMTAEMKAINDKMRQELS